MQWNIYFHSKYLYLRVFTFLLLNKKKKKGGRKKKKKSQSLAFLNFHFSKWPIPPGKNSEKLHYPQISQNSLQWVGRTKQPDFKVWATDGEKWNWVWGIVLSLIHAAFLIVFRLNKITQATDL